MRIVLYTACVLLCCLICTDVHANYNVAGIKNILIDDDFSTKKSYSAKNVTYTEVGGIGNPAPCVYLKKDTTMQRLTSNIPALSTGVYVVSFDFMKPTSDDCGAFMEITDKNGAANAFYLGISSSKLFLSCWDKDENLQKVTLEENFITDKWYNISLIVDISNKNIRPYVNGIRVAKESVCYMNPDVDAIGRLLDSRCYSSEYYLDNIYIYEDLIAEEIDFYDRENISADIVLPERGVSGGKISWKSSNTACITDDGKVGAQPDFTTSVVLTANITKGTVTEKRDYIVIIDGKNGRIVDAENIVEEIYHSDSYTLPSNIKAIVSDGSTVTVPVVWEGSIDRNLLEKEQIINGNVSNGAATVEAKITVLGDFVIKRLNLSDENDCVVIRMVENGSINSIMMQKNTSAAIEGNIIITVLDENKTALSCKIIDLETVGDWEENTSKIIDVDLKLEADNIDKCSVEVSVSDENGNKYCNSYIRNANDSLTSYSDILIVSDSTFSGTGRYVSKSNSNIKGWGEILPQFFDNSIGIYDFSTPKRLITDSKFLQPIINAGGNNDYLLVDFGHTDRAIYDEDDYPLTEDFRDELVTFLDDVYDHNLIPVLITPVFTQYSYQQLQEQYSEIICDIANKYHIPLIDTAKKLQEVLSDDIYWDDTGKYLTAEGTTKFCEIIVKELDSLETFIDEYIWYDVVNSTSNYKSVPNAVYRVHEIKSQDKESNRVYKFSDAAKINGVCIELLTEQANQGTIYIALYNEDNKLISVKSYEIPYSSEWTKNQLLEIPAVIDLADFHDSTATIKVMLFSEKISPYSAVYQLDK